MPCLSQSSDVSWELPAPVLSDLCPQLLFLEASLCSHLPGSRPRQRSQLPAPFDPAQSLLRAWLLGRQSLSGCLGILILALIPILLELRQDGVPGKEGDASDGPGNC